MKWMNKSHVIILALFALATGCTSLQTIPHAARAGDTVSLTVGWQKDLARDNLTITITDSLGVPTTYNPNDPIMRAVVNVYPDPVSRLVVGTQTQQGLGVDANTYGQVINDNITNQDQDWWNTTVYIDLPTTLPEGSTQITMSGPGGPLTASPIQLEILPGTGSPIGLIDSTWVSNPAEVPNMLGSLERADHFTISFSGTTVPHAIQMQIDHNAGIGVPWVVNPRGDLKNLVWSDDGSTITVLLTPTTGQTPTRFSDFKFYISGGVTGLLVTQLTAFDSDSNLILDVVPTIQ